MSGTQGSAAHAALVAAPIAQALGGWRAPLVTFGLLACVSVAAWLLPSTRRAGALLEPEHATIRRLPCGARPLVYQLAGLPGVLVLAGFGDRLGSRRGRG